MNFVQNFILQIILLLLKLLPFRIRIVVGKVIISHTIKIIPRLRQRILNNFDLVSNQIAPVDREDFFNRCVHNLSKTFTEFLFNQDFQKQLHLFRYDKKDLQRFTIAKQKKVPVIVVSGHFGPWEAIRAVLKANGFETGALYQKSKNQYYEPYHYKTIKAGGLPVLATERAGTKKMITHIRNGGFIAIMIDQAVSDGKNFTFMGLNAKTTTAVAEIALRYKALVIPAYANREEHSEFIKVKFHNPVKHTDVITMTQAINDNLQNEVISNPTQWYWLHNRWK
jgi:KDO2-lipid IV(A) lauroyltransferase